MVHRKQPISRSPAIQRKPVLLVAGPTASGKSALAAGLAERLGGTVINADSMQIYADLPILSARPGPEEEARAPHRLYGVLSGTERCSAGRWQAMALEEIDASHKAGRLPVVTGGTGLYLRALTAGIAPVPETPEDLLAAAQADIARGGPAAFHDKLRALDPRAAAAIRPSDTQRLIRAWAVMTASGRSILDWQADHPAPLEFDFQTILLLPDRTVLYPRCDARFAAMIEQGAVDEVRSLLAKGFDPGLPVMKAVGVREIAAWLAGEIDRDEMLRRGQTATRRYAKRQFTWFRNQTLQADTYFEQFSERLMENIFSKIRHFGLTGSD